MSSLFALVDIGLVGRRSCGRKEALHLPRDVWDDGWERPAPTHYTHRRIKLNPFELRFSVFNAAKDFLETQYNANMAAWELLNKTSKEITELAPKFPTMEEVIDKAIEINKFVSDAQREEVLKLKRSGVSVIF